MSTRSTIADGPYWHLFHDVVHGGVWLRMELAELRHCIDNADGGTTDIEVRMPPDVLAALQGVKER